MKERKISSIFEKEKIIAFISFEALHYQKWVNNGSQGIQSLTIQTK